MTIVSVEQALPLIGAIYDAATDPRLWNTALGYAACFVGGSSAVLFTKDLATKRIHIHHESGLDPYYRQLYIDKYARLDPSLAGRCAAEPEQTLTAGDLMPDDGFRKTRFFREWAQPQGIVDLLAAVLDRSASDPLVLSIFRYECDGAVDSEARQRMSVVVPHIRRAMLIGGMIDRKVSAVTTFAETLNGLRAGICLVDANGRVVHANNACRAIFRAGDFLSRTEERITARDAKTDRILRELLTAAQVGAASEIKDVALPLRAPDGTRYVAHVLPLTAETPRFATANNAATAALFIRKATIDALPSPDVIALSYNLTPTELRVLLAIVEVGGVPEVAASLGVAETTVKTHLGRLFEKTGVSRQADLVKIVAGFASPLAD
jgi:DNA-binding CsgD family transcriptional regulator